jgi:hypothetical protein
MMPLTQPSETPLVPPTTERVREQIAAQSVLALRAHRLDRRHARLIEPEILTPDQAELHDLNRVVWSAVEGVLPICRALGVRLLLEQDPRLPAVPMLVRPIEDALDAALDLCLAEGSVVRVRTRACTDRAVTTVERWCASRGRRLAHWCDAGAMGQVELMVGDRAARALGGRLRILRRADDLRFRLELPSGSRPPQAWSVGEERARPRPARRPRLSFPPRQLDVGLSLV